LDLILSKRIDFWPSRLAGTMDTDSCASPTSWYIVRDDFTGICNDVRASIADQGSLSTSVIDIPLAYIIGGVINIELINARYKWI